jgi:kynurenine formamidase
VAEWPVPTKQRMDEIFETVKNWGRWGKDDEIGALNLISESVRRGGAQAVRQGRAISCSLDMPVSPAVDNPHPALHMMVQGGDDCLVPHVGLEMTSDFVGIAFHGMASSHLDALCHVAVDGKIYNGFDVTEVKSTGACRNSVMAAKDGIVSRGVLLDIPRLHGREWLEPAEVVTPDHLDAAEKSQGVEVREGDVLLFSTGRDARRAAMGAWSPLEVGMAGLHPECLPWLHERGVAVLGSDGISDVIPVPAIEGWAMPIHETTLVAMGVHLLDNLALGELCSACADTQQWDFQFSALPLRVQGGTGSPLNPVALL